MELLILVKIDIMKVIQSSKDILKQTI